MLGLEEQGFWSHRRDLAWDYSKTEPPASPRQEGYVEKVFTQIDVPGDSVHAPGPFFQTKPLPGTVSLEDSDQF